MNKNSQLVAACLTFSLMTVSAAQAEGIRPDQAAFREIYKELVETNTTLSAGSCTEAAQKMAARLRAAGYPDSDLHLFSTPDHPKEGGLVAILPGTDAKAKAILLLAHIDVVEAKREDWERDPFKLIEEGGYFYARGSLDDKSMAATWVDTLIRLRGERTKPRRTIKMALTCGEETSGAFNGAEYLVKEQRDLIDAAFALNEGSWGMLDANGKRVMMGVQAGEKTTQNFRLEVTNPGGHSSRPVKNNAIYHLAGALKGIEAYAFPIKLNDTTRVYFSRMATIVGGEAGAAMTKLVADPTDAAAAAKVAEDPTWNGMLHTTCVATMLDAGHATNALPQRARANVNCRIYPNEPIESVRQALEKAAALKRDDPAIRTSLAYAYLLRNDNKAWDEATAALKLDPNIAEAHYILGVSSLRSASYNVAYERAKKAIALNPKFTNAYLLKSQALISSFAQQSGTVIRPVSSRGEMLQEAAGDLEKYLSLGPKITNIEFYKDYFESIRFFAEFYNRPENQKPISFDPAPVDDPKVTPLKITAKPRANYTDGARTNGISGIVRLLVGFSADGTIKHILILKSLDSGLDRNAVAAARQIRFEPKQIDGKPVSVVRVVEYSFTVY